MSDLSYTIEVKGVQDLDKLGNVIEKLTGTLNAGAGAGKSLEELRKILVGLKGKGSALEELATAAKGFTDATAEMRKGIGDNFKSLERLLKSEFKQLTTVMQQGGAAAGAAAGVGVAQGMKDSAAVVEKETTALSKSAKANLKALQQDLAGYHNMLRLQVGSQNMRGKQATRMSVDDTRALLGMPDRDSMVQLAAQIKSQMQDALKTEGLRGRSASKMSVDDTRALLGMPDRDSMVQLAAQIKSQMQESMAKEKLRASSASKMTEEDTRALFGLPSRAEMKTFAAQLKAQMRDAVQSAPIRISKTDLADMKYTEAMSGMRAYYQEQEKASTSSQGFFARLREGGAAMDEAGKKGTALGRVFRAMTVDGNDAHSMARGLASGFNLLWLTWGNLAPLFAGATISYGVKSVVTMGAEVQNTMETIRVLSQETTASVAALNDQMLELARSGPFGPQAIADAMKTLSLAGLDAASVGSAIKDVLNFAVAGTTDLKTAADVMTSVATAFGIAATGYNYVGDIIAKTAAVSKSSVESIGEAFKTASVINKQYGISLEDVGVGLAALSNLGIQGSAAGTALRNMYADLSERTPKVAKAMESVGMKLRDQNGQFKDIISMVMEFDRVMSDLSTGLEKKALLRDVLSERGAKPLIELRDLATRVAKEVGTTTMTELEKLKARIVDSAGFMANAAAEMAMTPLNQMKSVTASLQATLVEAFNGLAPVILQVTARLKEAFASEEFKTGLATLMQLVSSLTIAIVENIGVLTKLAAAFALFKGTQIVLGIFNSITMAVAGMTAAFTGLTIKAVAASTLFTRLIGLFNPITAVLTVAYTAWQLYSIYTDKANKSTEAAATSGYHDQLIAKLEEETKRLNENTEAMRLNISVDELRAQREGRKLADAAQDSRRGAINSARANIGKAQSDYEKLAATPFAQTGAGARELVILAKRVENARDELWKLVQNNMAQDARMDSAKQSLKNAAQENADEVRRQAAIKAAIEAARVGSNTYKPIDPYGGDKTALKAVSAVRQNLMKETEEANRNELASIKSHYDSKQRLLKSQGDNQLILQAEFLTREIELTQESEAKQLQALSEGAERYTAAYEAQTAALSASYSEWMAKNPKATAEQVDKQLQDTQTAMLNLGREYNTTIAKMKQDAGAIKDNAFERLQLSINKAKGELLALQRTFADFWTKEANVEKAKKRATALEDQLRFASPEQTARIQAMSGEFEKWQTEIDRTESELSKLNDEYEWYWDQLAVGRVLSDAQLVNFDLTADKVAEVRKQLEKLRAAQKGGTAQAGESALTKFGKDEFKRLQDGVADAIMSGLFEGGRQGKRKLRDLLVSELKKPIRVMVDVVANMVMSGVQVFLGGGSGGASGGGSGIMGAVQNGVSLYNNASSMSTFGGQFLNGTTAWGPGGSVSGVLSNPGSYSMGEMAGAAAPYLAGGFAAYGLGEKYGAVGGTLGGMGVGAVSAGAASVAAGGTFTAGAGALMTNPYGWILTAALAILGADDSGTIHAGGGSQYNTALDELKTSTEAGMFGTGFGSVDENEAAISWTSDLAKGIGTGLSSIATAFGKDAGFEIATAFADDTSKDGAWGALRISQGGSELVNWADTQTSRWAPKEFANGEKGQKEYLNAIAKDTMQVLKDMELPRWASELLDTLGDAPTMEELSKVASYIQAVQGAFKNLGEYLPSFKELTGEAATNLLELAGGIDNLVQGASYFYQNFYSEKERYETSMSQLADALADAGVSVPKTKDAYRELVEAQDLNTKEGRELYSTLIKLAPSFVTLSEVAEQLRLEMEKATDDALSILTEFVEKERKILQARIDAAQEVVDNLSEVFDILKSNIRELYMEVDATRAMTQAQGQSFLDQAVATARATGYMPEAAPLSEAIGAVRSGFDNKNFTNKFEADRARLRTAAQLSELAEYGYSQMSIAEQALTVAKDQLVALNTQYELALTQLDEFRSANAGIKTLNEAFANFAAKLFEESGGTSGSAGTGTGSTGGSTDFVVGGGGSGTYIPTYETQGDRIAADIAAWEAAGKDWKAVYSPSGGLTIVGDSAGSALSDTEKEWLSSAGVPGYASGGVHSGGWAMVGEQGKELVNLAPSRVYSNSDTQDILAGDSSAAEETHALRAEVAEMRAEIRAVASATNKTQKMLDRVMPGGEYILVKQVA